MGSADINYFLEGVNFILEKKSKITNWITQVIEKEKYKAGNLNFIFCSDSYINDMNVKYLEHDTYTDIITFDMSENEDDVSGDIFISIERAIENSKMYNKTLQEEVRRLLAHGILHLLGYGDKTGPEKKIMTEKEDLYLILFRNLS